MDWFGSEEDWSGTGGVWFGSILYWFGCRLLWLVPIFYLLDAKKGDFFLFYWNEIYFFSKSVAIAT
ncbi:hypothetical protein HMPREF9372_0697 [Sporosarcina newyorkensis 2681]|uniref:Uncharacterized protein n=1 Tax=Sporosarcina newyorkensis 2681 TaxID=1027292 RepID=F9DPG7_9BACL|nr:hypothetical protein HMPREF9372_0697 [Sporosarcina newyorkensis 2681]